MANWYDDALQLRDFAEAVENAIEDTDSNDVLAKPYKYTNEFLAWQRNGFPSPKTDLTTDQNDSDWDAFIDDLGSEEEEESEEVES